MILWLYVLFKPPSFYSLFSTIAESLIIQYDIVVVVDQVPNDIKVTLNYWDARLPEITVARLASSFDAILTFFITNPLLKPLDVLENFSCL